MDLGTKYEYTSIHPISNNNLRAVRGVTLIVACLLLVDTKNRDSFAKKDFVKYRIVQKTFSTLKLHITNKNKRIFNIYAQNEKKKSLFFNDIAILRLL